MTSADQERYEARVHAAKAAYRAAIAARQQEILARYAPSACFLSAEETEEAIEKEFDSIETALRAELDAALAQAARDFATTPQSPADDAPNPDP